ncbi:MAG: SURF1 family protein [Glaciecola sp.]
MAQYKRKKVEHLRLVSPNIPFPYLATIVAFGAIVIMLSLGFWQLERKAEKETRLAHIAHAKVQAPISLSSLVANPGQYQDYSLSLSGRFIDRVFYIDNKLHEGRPGYHVVAPYQTERGIAMVNLGWVPSLVNAKRDVLPEYTLPTDHSSISAIVYLPTKNTLVTETNRNYGEFPAVLQQVDLDEISGHLSAPVLPFILRMENNSNSDYVRNWTIITMAPEKHLGYAIQWFGLAIAALTIYLLSLVKRLQGPHPKNDV